MTPRLAKQAQVGLSWWVRPFAAMHFGAGFVGGSRAPFCPSVTTVPPRGHPPSVSISLYPRHPDASGPGAIYQLSAFGTQL